LFRKQPSTTNNQKGQEDLERIRERLMTKAADESNERRPAMGSQTPVAAALPCLAIAAEAFKAAEQHAVEARDIRQALATERQPRHAARRAASLRSRTEGWMAWYTGPAERYWDAVLNGVEHVVAALKAQNSVIRQQAAAIRQLREETAIVPTIDGESDAGALSRDASK
jgi:hypothetical protein